VYEPSKRKLTWPNRAVAHCYGADVPALLRGPQHKKGWVDELASFQYDEAFDNFLLGLRLGDRPQVVVTTTPKPRKQLTTLLKDPRPRSPAARPTRTSRTWPTRSATRSSAATRALASVVRN